MNVEMSSEMEFAESVPARVQVLLPLPLPSPYDYAVPAGLELAPGDYVQVPLGGRQVIGVVWAEGPGAGAVAAEKLKPVTQHFDVPPMPDVLRQFIEWVAAYTFAPVGAVLALGLKVKGALEPPHTRTLYRLGSARPERMTKARARLLELAADGLARSVADLAELAGVGPDVVRKLIQAGVFTPIEIAERQSFPPPNPVLPGPVLSADQAAAAHALRAAVAKEAFAPILLDGVTGAGKTETYFEALAETIERGKQVLILLPEIALTVHFLDRFEKRFGAPPAIWHSDLAPARRRNTWRGVADGSVQVVVGARSALFLPFPDLGLIIVDEEHDTAFKQEDGVVYNARDMAVARANLGGFPVILSTATPSLETVVNAEQGRYRALHLPKRHGVARLPSVEIVDMRQDPPPPGHWLSPPLVAAMAETLEAGEQSLLFLNRRGYAPLTLCRACGHRLDCPQCDAWLVAHQRYGGLLCHHCGHRLPEPESCPACGAEGKLVAVGPGVERVAQEVAELFPQASLALLSSDMQPRGVKGTEALQDVFRAVEEGTIDVLVGTQVVAKGHHFAKLTLVGVVDADLGLGGSDLRAAERTHQLLSQVAGRAGREARPGKVLLQSHMPDNHVLQALASGDRDAFLAREKSARESYGLPPFGRLVALILSGPEERALGDVAAGLARRAPRAEGIRVLGPAPAPLAVLRGRHRMRLLVKAERKVNIQAYLAAWLGDVRLPRAIRLTVDVDPYSFM